MTASASDATLTRLRKIMDRKPFWAYFERLGPDEYRFKETGETFTRVWASYIFGQVAHVGEVFE